MKLCILLAKKFLVFILFTEQFLQKPLGIKVPNKIYAHGLLRDKDGRKMSKSLNNVIEPEYLFSKYHDEMIKYYFASAITFGEDGNFSEEKPYWHS